MNLFLTYRQDEEGVQTLRMKKKHGARRNRFLNLIFARRHVQEGVHALRIKQIRSALRNRMLKESEYIFGTPTR